MKPRRVSMRDVARASGVTAATVSRALRKDPRLSEATRARVQAAVKRLGYTLLPELSVLMGACRRKQIPEDRPTMALLSSLESRIAWQSGRSPNITQLRESALARAAELGFETEDVWAGDFDSDPERIAAYLRVRSIRRVLLGPAQPPTVPPVLDAQEFTIVTLGAPLVPGVAAVFNDHYLACVTAVRECHLLGYRRPGLVLPAHYNRRDQGRWEAGYLIGVDSVPGVTSVPLLSLPHWEDVASFESWYQQHVPDVIVAATLGSIERHAKSLGLRVPADVGLVSLGVSRLGARESGIFQDSPYIGRRAVELLAELSAAAEPPAGGNALNVAIAGRWNRGRTLRPRV